MKLFGIVRLTRMRLSPSDLFYCNVETISVRNNKQTAKDVTHREN